ncbi:MAG TPA: hypothetical protein VF475_12620 [Sphingobium sp.]
MTRIPLFAIVSAALFATGACSEKTDQQAQDAANSAGRDIEAAADRAGNAIDRAANSISATADRTGDNIEGAADRAGNEMENGAQKAKAKTGAALERAGKHLQD